MHVLIPRNKQLPTEGSHTFSPNENEQEAMKINVYEGEDESLEKNTLLAELILTLPPNIKTTDEIKVTFNIDMSGYLSIKAKGKTEKNEEISLERTLNKIISSISQEEIDRMRKEIIKSRSPKVKQQEIDAAKLGLKSFCVNMKKLIEKAYSLKKISDLMQKKICRND